MILLLVGLRPLLGPAKCYYKVGCTQFAIIQLNDKDFFQACKAIFLRLISCNPVAFFIENFIFNRSFMLFKNAKLSLLFGLLFYTVFTKSSIERQSITFVNCDAEVILDANTLQKIVIFLIKNLDQQTTGDLCLHCSDKGYTLLQALQKGGYITLYVENATKKTYIDWVIHNRTDKKYVATCLKKIKHALKASTYN